MRHCTRECETARGATGIGGGKTKGRKRQIVVDVPGCLLSVVVHAANRGTFISDLKEQLSLDVDISEKIEPHQWQKLPWRRVVERTLSWLNHSRRLSKDYEISVSSVETMVKISHSHTLPKHL